MIQMQKNWMFSPNGSEEAGTSLSGLWIYMSLRMLLLLLCGLVSQLACSVRKYIANVCDYSSSPL